jgi:hypothetical protein
MALRSRRYGRGRPTSVRGPSAAASPSLIQTNNQRVASPHKHIETQSRGAHGPCPGRAAAPPGGRASGCTSFPPPCVESLCNHARPGSPCPLPGPHRGLARRPHQRLHLQPAVGSAGQRNSGGRRSHGGADISVQPFAGRGRHGQPINIRWHRAC